MRAGHWYRTPEGGREHRQHGELGRRTKRPRRQALGLFEQDGGVLSAFQVFDPVSAYDTGEYTCQAQNGYGTPMMSDGVRMEAGECGQVWQGLEPDLRWALGLLFQLGRCSWHHGRAVPRLTSRLCLTVEPNVGGVVAAVLVTLILLGLLIFGIWFAYSRGYFHSKYSPSDFPS